MRFPHRIVSGPFARRGGLLSPFAGYPELVGHRVLEEVAEVVRQDVFLHFLTHANARAALQTEVRVRPRSGDALAPLRRHPEGHALRVLADGVDVHERRVTAPETLHVRGLA